MTTTSDVSARAISKTRTNIHPLNALAVLCAIVLGAALCMATYGLDLSVGFF